MERPLFLPQYVSAAPAIAPSPADLLSCIKMITVYIYILKLLMEGGISSHHITNW